MTGGQTEEQFIANIVAAMGTTFDPILLGVLAYMEAAAQARVAAANNTLAAAQSDVTTYAVV